MQHRRRITGYTTAEEIAADYLFEMQGNVAEAQRLVRRRIVSEDDYQQVAKLIEAATERNEATKACISPLSSLSFRSITQRCCAGESLA